MNNSEIVQIFENMGVDAYDGFNLHFQSLSESMHFLTMLTLKDLPENANILCVGVGTGADIMNLAKMKKKWNFTGIEPSGAMLDGCKKKIEVEGLSDRCDFFQGYLSDFDSNKKYDATLCFFVFHFIEREERKKIYADMKKYLKEGGYVIHSEISFDGESEEYPHLLENWKSLHGYAGATAEKLSQMGDNLRSQLAILSPEETKQLIQECGLKDPTHFFQSFFIHAWHSRKS